MESILEKQKVEGFNKGVWNTSINVRDFVIKNLISYYGDDQFLVGPSKKTQRLWDVCKGETEVERINNGVHSVDTETISAVASFKSGYIDKENEVIVGLQTDQLLKRAMKPFGGYKVVQKALQEQGFAPSEEINRLFTNSVKTHYDGVFDAYTEEIKKFSYDYQVILRAYCIS